MIIMINKEDTMPDLACWGGDIVPEKDGYMPKNVMLRCKKCGKTGWHTKNIGYIGARTIYNFKGGCDEMEKMQTCVPECSCPAKFLEVDEKLMEHVKNCKRCREYGL